MPVREHPGTRVAGATANRDNDDSQNELRSASIRLEGFKGLVDREGGKARTHAAVSIGRTGLSQEHNTWSRKPPQGGSVAKFG